jgi:anthranilate phosphoribosyltransferase
VQLVGAASPEAARLMADALVALGLQHGFVVHGSDGLDEITTTGPTLAFEICGGEVLRRELHPADFGVPVAAPGDLAGGTPEENAGIAISLLEGARGARRDVVLVNAAAALVAAGQAPDFPAAMRVAAASIDSGSALKKLNEMRSSGVGGTST